MSNLIGVNFVADDPIQFALTAVQNKNEINSFKTSFKSLKLFQRGNKVLIKI
jgi:hypothetical protein